MDGGPLRIQCYRYELNLSSNDKAHCFQVRKGQKTFSAQHGMASKELPCTIRFSIPCMLLSSGRFFKFSSFDGCEMGWQNS